MESIDVSDRARKNIQGKLGEAGMTLPEVMVVLGIVVVAATLAIPNYIAWTAKSRLKQASTELHSTLNMSRMLAMNRNSIMTLTLGIVGGRVTATVTAPGSTQADCVADTRRCVLPRLVMPVEVTGVAGFVGATPQVPPQVQYTSLGLLTGVGTNTQTINLTNSYGLTYQIQVTPNGKARWCAGPCS
jgi:type IV fimbrial biogenesis protein FimT